MSPFHSFVVKRFCKRYQSALLFSGGTALIAVAALSPCFWLGTWLGWALFAAAIAVARTTKGALCGVVLGLLAFRAVWLQWAFAMARAMLPTETALSSVVAVGASFIVVAALPGIATLTLGLLLFRRRPCVCFWLPLAWALADPLEDAWSHLGSDRLFTQVDVAPVMRALGYLGHWPAVLITLFAATSFGEGLARKRWRLLIPAPVVVLLFALLPPLPRGDVAVLEGVGAVHMRSRFEMPAVDSLAPDLALVIWPEVSIGLSPRIEEGRPSGVSLDSPLGGPLTQHIVGAMTKAHGKEQNSALAVAADGSILATRAKTQLMPMFERKFLGFGSSKTLPGSAPPFLQLAGRKIIPLICGELLGRRIIGAGRAAGGELAVVLAHDKYQAGLAIPDWQVLAAVRIRAIEFGVPVIYSSMVGRSSIIAADGTVLARSAQGAPSGVLTWSRKDGALDRHDAPSPLATVLYSISTPELHPDCPFGRCVFRTLEDVDCMHEKTSDIVIVAGHSAPPRYLGKSAVEIATRIACFHPKILVLDTCFGASFPLLSELATRLPDTWVVASTQLVAERGFRYGISAFSDGPLPDRLRAISTVPPSPLFVARLELDALNRAAAEVASASGDELRPRVRSWSPTLVSVTVGEPGANHTAVAPADWKKIGHPPAPRERVQY